MLLDNTSQRVFVFLDGTRLALSENPGTKDAGETAHLIVEKVIQAHDVVLVFGVVRIGKFEELDLIQALVKVVFVVLQGQGRVQRLRRGRV